MTVEPENSSSKTKNRVFEILNKILSVDVAKSNASVAVLSEELTLSEMYLLNEEAQKAFLKEPPLLQLVPPVRLVGDVHGQFIDVVRLFSSVGFPPQHNYVFIGDFVDRGPQSLELMSLLLALKILFPLNFFLLRGNHESSLVTRHYGFLEECRSRYNVKLWRRFTECFNFIPFCALISGKIFCTHGGLSPDLYSFNDILQIRRPIKIPEQGLICDLVWSDPNPRVIGWRKNNRGTSYFFGRDVIEEKVRQLGIELVVRAHQLIPRGAEFQGGTRLLTVFTAPNYVKDFDNLGAVLNVDKDLKCNFIIMMPRKTNSSPSLF